MTKDDLAAIKNKLNQFEHTLLRENWANKLLVKKKGQLEIVIPFAATEVNQALGEFIKTDPKLTAIHISQRIASMKVTHKAPLKTIKNIIVVSSAKGGVGKSTTAVNLALALQAQGAKVGMLDADIYGPSLPLMLNAQNKTPVSKDGKMMEPVMAHGLATNSIGYLIADEEAMVWRGPMASKAFSQLLNETNWGELDYLVIDMPPGTGDIQLSLAQQFPVTGAVIITTPQDLALIDAIKGVMMFRRVQLPVIGIVENMSYHICSNCGHHDAIFGEGGARKLAEKQGTELLGELPLATEIRASIDQGMPTVIAEPNSEFAKRYIELAAKTASELYWQGEVLPEQIAINIG